MRQDEVIKAAEEFKEIYKDDFHIELTNDEAIKKSQEILQLFNCLVQIKKI